MFLFLSSLLTLVGSGQGAGGEKKQKQKADVIYFHKPIRVSQHLIQCVCVAVGASKLTVAMAIDIRIAI